MERTLIEGAYYKARFSRSEADEVIKYEQTRWWRFGSDSDYYDSDFSYISREPIQMEQESKISRVEVIGNGREYVNMNTGNVTVQYQDDGRTLKVFVQKGIGAKQSEQPKEESETIDMSEPWVIELADEIKADVDKRLDQPKEQHTLTPITDAEIEKKATGIIPPVMRRDEVTQVIYDAVGLERREWIKGYKQSIADRGGFTEGEVKAICDKYIDYLFHSEQIPNYADGTDSEMWTKWLTDYLTSKKQK